MATPGWRADASRHRAARLGAPGREEIGAAVPGHVATVRRLFVDVLTPEQLDVIADAAEAVLARLDGESEAA